MHDCASGLGPECASNMCTHPQTNARAHTHTLTHHRITRTHTHIYIYMYLHNLTLMYHTGACTHARTREASTHCTGARMRSIGYPTSAQAPFRGLWYLGQAKCNKANCLMLDVRHMFSRAQPFTVVGSEQVSEADGVVTSAGGMGEVSWFEDRCVCLEKLGSPSQGSQGRTKSFIDMSSRNAHLQLGLLEVSGPGQCCLEQPWPSLALMVCVALSFPPST